MTAVDTYTLEVNAENSHSSRSHRSRSKRVKYRSGTVTTGTRAVIGWCDSSNITVARHRAVVWRRPTRVVIGWQHFPTDRHRNRLYRLLLTGVAMSLLTMTTPVPRTVLISHYTSSRRNTMLVSMLRWDSAYAFEGGQDTHVRKSVYRQTVAAMRV